MSYFGETENINQDWALITTVVPDDSNMVIISMKILRWHSIRITFLICELDFILDNNLPPGTHTLTITIPELKVIGEPQNSLLFEKTKNGLTTYATGLLQATDRNIVLRAFPFQAGATYRMKSQIFFES